MLVTLFRLLGASAFVLGLIWTLAVLATPDGSPSSGAVYAGMFIGKVLAATPGLSLAFAGLMLLAVGETLWQLGRIARLASKAVNNTAEIAEALQVPKPKEGAATTFNDAVQLFQAKTGKSEPGAAIRDLATDSLRQKGFLQ